MNGTTWKPDGSPMHEAQAVAFHDQITAFFSQLNRFWELTDRRLEQRLEEIGAQGDLITMDDYVACNERLGWDVRSGFENFTETIGHGPTSRLGSGLWEHGAPSS